jgi:hypothetical protein
MAHQIRKKLEHTSATHELERTDQAMQVEHHLKCWPEFFEAIRAGKKRHDLRRSDDREFHVGDRLVLEEFDPQCNVYTGRTQAVCITYITSGELPCALSRDALDSNYCILSIAPE